MDVQVFFFMEHECLKEEERKKNKRACAFICSWTPY